MVLAELITASGSMITAWVGVLTEVRDPCAARQEGRFHAVTG